MTRFDASFEEEKNVRRPAFPFLSLLFQRVLLFSPFLLLCDSFCIENFEKKKTSSFKKKVRSFVRSFQEKHFKNFSSPFHRAGALSLSSHERPTDEARALAFKERRRVCLSLFVYRGVDAIRRNEERERRATMVEVIELLDSDEEGDERIRIVQRQNEQDVRPVEEEGRRDGDVVITGTRAPHAEERERERDALSNFLGVGFFFPRARATFF